ncbi:DUF4190 domain-containing protein [Streptomyces sp. NPDC002809]|uniref:DUF4190 domain-containing protein n=1 Tax=Streptomyces sp. NPDC002809 TaxID=3154433 RepID=UPI00332F552E
MTLTAFTRRSEAAAPSAGYTSARAAPSSPTVRSSTTVPVKRSARDADGLAVASFVLGLLGLLVMNLVLGPMAVVMAIVALARSTTRRGRALLGLALGVADLAVLAFVVTGNGVVAWSFGG